MSKKPMPLLQSIKSSHSDLKALKAIEEEKHRDRSVQPSKREMSEISTQMS